MRIVAGAYRGRSLVAPKGHSTRPTADRVRQALFNIQEHAAWSPGLKAMRVIDLFAGSGSLGIEALSRGAAMCRFLDQDAAAAAAIEANLAALSLGDRASVERRDIARLGERPASLNAGFDIAYLDPPYGQGLAEIALAALERGDWLAPGAVAIVERGAGEAPLVAPGFETLDSRVWGAAKVWFLRLDFPSVGGRPLCVT